MILTLVLLLSGIVLVSALGGIVATALHKPPMWFILMFEVVVAVTCVFGVLTGLGRFSEAPALSMMITGGIVVVAAVLSEPAVVLKLAGRGGSPVEMFGMTLVPFALARLGAGGAILLLSAITVLIRDPKRSLAYLLRAAILGAPVVLALGLAASGRGQAAIANLSQGVVFGLTVAAFFVLGGLFCASAHCLIRAFEVGIRVPAESAPGKAA